MLKSLKLLRDEGNVRACPKCSMAYQKISGCDHVKCAKCGHDFNYDRRDKKQDGTTQILQEEEMLSREDSSSSIASASAVSSWRGCLWRAMKNL